MIFSDSYLRPFSATFGRRCLIPGTPYVVEAFPALLRIYEMRGIETSLIKEVPLTVKGPLKEFAIFQDIERKSVTVCSEQFRCHILPSLTILFQKKNPQKRLLLKESLSLGSHKKQEWESMYRRGDFRDIFPLWFGLGRLLDLPPSGREGKGVFALLDQCYEVMEHHRPENILPAFKKLFLAGFHHLLVPRLEDGDHQGILMQKSSPLSPLYLLYEGALLIRSLFIQTSKEGIAFLPHLPPAFFCGRMMSISCGKFGSCDFEWTKKKMRRIVLRSTYEGKLHLKFPSSLKRFRLRSTKKELGTIKDCREALEIKSDTLYLLDRFEK